MRFDVCCKCIGKQCGVLCELPEAPRENPRKLEVCPHCAIGVSQSLGFRLRP
jgi:hypothetical protein